MTTTGDSVPGIESLAEFDRSPLVEVALAVAFHPLPGLRTVEFGRLWTDRFEQRFPKVQEQAPVQMAVEQFGRPRTGPSLSLELVETPPTPRLWFLNEHETDLVQVQNNWFARNWRHGNMPSEYPRYPRIRAAFERDLTEFLQHAATRGLGAFRPTQCEIAYFNHIPLQSDGPSDLRDILSILQKRPADPLGNPESVRVGLQYVIPDAGGTQVGRLYFAAEPALRRSDAHPIVVLNVVARGRPLGNGVQGVLSFLDTGHAAAVEGFVTATTAKMHQLWGKQDDD